MKRNKEKLNTLQLLKQGLRLSCPPRLVFKDKKKYNRRKKHSSKEEEK